MVDFSFTTLDNAITMNDVIVTVCAFLAGWTKLSQKAKDQQIADRDKHIVWLQERLDEVRGIKAKD